MAGPPAACTRVLARMLPKQSRVTSAARPLPSHHLLVTGPSASRGSGVVISISTLIRLNPYDAEVHADPDGPLYMSNGSSEYASPLSDGQVRALITCTGSKVVLISEPNQPDCITRWLSRKRQGRLPGHIHTNYGTQYVWRSCFCWRPCSGDLRDGMTARRHPAAARSCRTRRRRCWRRRCRRSA